MRVSGKVKISPRSAKFKVAEMKIPHKYRLEDIGGSRANHTVLLYSRRASTVKSRLKCKSLHKQQTINYGKPIDRWCSRGTRLAVEVRVDGEGEMMALTKLHVDFTQPVGTFIV